ncbi:MAG: hypothetical protein FJ100_18095 [Deltaproteobacteria bacterium]|nr:hypothetical protein [Deltaproteobacteria bacterium]
MALRPVYIAHPAALTVELGDLHNAARATSLLLGGTPGALVERSNANGFRFYARQFYDAAGKRRETYIAGPIGDPEADALAEATAERIAESRRTIDLVRMLGREGFQVADAAAFAVIAALHNRAVFAGGAVLVGSHAFGVLTNALGIRVSAYATDDIDLARGAQLAISSVPSEGLIGILRESGLPFVEIPGLDPRRPPTSFKLPGPTGLHVDVLCPAGRVPFAAEPVPELGTHATGMPRLRYLLAETQMAVFISRAGVAEVRVPVGERFALHKLMVSQMRVGRDAKAAKDLAQAAVLLAALAEWHPGAVEAAAAGLSAGERKLVAKARPAVSALLVPHPRAVEVLAGVV